MSIEETQAKLDRIESDIRSIVAEKAEQVMTDGEIERLENLKRGAEKARQELRQRLIDGEGLERLPGDGHIPETPGNDRDPIWSRTLSPFAHTNEIRSHGLTAVERMGHASDRLKETATKLIENDATGKIARHAAESSSPHYVRAFEKKILGQEALWTEEERQAVSRAMSLTDTSGGFLVPFMLDPSVVVTSDGSTNPFRRVARQVMATSDVYNPVESAAVSWSWDAEAAEVSDDATTFSSTAITIHKSAGFVPISLEAMQDAANVAGEVAKLLRFGKDTLESAAFATGSGSGQPVGIVTALSGTASEISATTTSAFGLVDVYLLDEDLPARYRASSQAAWMANRAILNDIRQFTVSGGADVWADLADGQPSTLLGVPAYEASDMTGTITTNAQVLVVGDWDHYVVADRIGTQIEFIPHLFGSNQRPTGQRGWYAYTRVGADSVNDGAFSMLKLG